MAGRKLAPFQHRSDDRRARCCQPHHEGIAICVGQLLPAGTGKSLKKSAPRRWLALGIERDCQCAIIPGTTEICGVIQRAAIGRDGGHEGVGQSGAGGLRRVSRGEIAARVPPATVAFPAASSAMAEIQFCVCKTPGEATRLTKDSMEVWPRR